MAPAARRTRCLGLTRVCAPRPLVRYHAGARRCRGGRTLPKTLTLPCALASGYRTWCGTGGRTGEPWAVRKLTPWPQGGGKHGGHPRRAVPSRPCPQEVDGSNQILALLKYIVDSTLLANAQDRALAKDINAHIAALIRALTAKPAPAPPALSPPAPVW